MKQAAFQHIRLDAPQKEVSVPIIIGKGLLPEIHSFVKMDSYSRIAILTDKNVLKHWGKTIQKTFGKNDVLINIPAGESQKNLITVQNIWATLLQHKFDRKSLLVCIGGGVVCDIGAFAASTYMRGIDFVNMPTTLLAQTDAAIGGKTGINFGGLKNMIGTFAQPQSVICDVRFLSTLPKREYLSGFAEVIKHALISDVSLFNHLSAVNLEKVDEEELEEILFWSCSIKCNVVAMDIIEKAKRKILNFGHTIGHAIEMASQDTGKPLLHGEAIAIGMIAEARLSLLAGLIKEKEFEAIKKLMVKAKLPSRIDRKFEKSILQKILSDKKNERQRIKWVLLKGIGKAVIDVEQPERLVKQAIEYVLA